LFVTPKREAVAAKTADDLQNKRRRSVDPQRRASGAREFRASIGLLIQAEVQIAGFADPVLAAAIPLIRDQNEPSLEYDCPFGGRRLHLRCGLWTTLW
jgi:hypothetical protein